MIERKAFIVLKYFVAARSSALTPMLVPIARCEAPIRVPQTQSAFRRVHNEPLTVVAMRVCNPDHSPASRFRFLNAPALAQFSS